MINIISPHTCLSFNIISLVSVFVPDNVDRKCTQFDTAESIAAVKCLESQHVGALIVNSTKKLSLKKGLKKKDLEGSGGICYMLPHSTLWKPFGNQTKSFFRQDTVDIKWCDSHTHTQPHKHLYWVEPCATHTPHSLNPSLNPSGLG